MSAAEIDPAKSLRAAVAVALQVAGMVREMGREGHDLPVTCLGHVADALASDEDAARALLIRGYWGELIAFEPTRPTELVGADEQTRSAVVAMTRAARWATVYATWLPPKGVPSFGVRLSARNVIGESGNALVACGWTPMDAWAEVMQRYEGAGGEVCW